jgi:hypothetical protein
MTKITTDFNGDETLAQQNTKLRAIFDFWWGAGSWAAGSVRGATSRLALNTISPTPIYNGDPFAAWLLPLNALNEPDKLLNDTLKDANPAAFILADDTARIFGPDGVTAVSAPGTVVSLAADDWEGLELGGEISPNTAFDDTTGLDLNAGATVSGGQLVFTSVSTAEGARFTLASPLAAGEAVLVEVDIASLSGGQFRVRANPGAYADILAGTGVRRVVIVPSSSTSLINIHALGTTTGAINTCSFKKILNWPAYQNTAAARPTWGRAPKEVRNLLTNSDLAGAVAGTPGTPPTGWTNQQTTGEISAVAADGLLGGNSIRFVASAARRMIFAPVTVLANTTYIQSAMIEVYSGSVPVSEIVRAGNAPAGTTVTYEIDGVAALSTDVPSVGLHMVSTIIVVGSTGGTINSRIGVGTVIDVTGDIRIWAPQFEIGSARSAYQRRGATPTDTTESGVTSFGLISMDGSDDALLHQLAAGGTVSVALFGRGGSYLIPSITLAAPSVLQLGPLSVLDDGVLVSGCPEGILRAVGTVPWSSRFELVGYAIMKANPTAEEQARAMRYFAAFGARGWLVEGPELVPADAFTNAGLWTLGAGWSISGDRLVGAVVSPSIHATLPFTTIASAPYLLRYTVDAYTSGLISSRFLGSPSGPTYSTTGTFSEILIAATGSVDAGVSSRATSFAGSVSTLSLRQLIQEF